jgi:hypothetical protein
MGSSTDHIQIARLTGADDAEVGGTVELGGVDKDEGVWWPGLRSLVGLAAEALDGHGPPKQPTPGTSAGERLCILTMRLC